MNFVVEQTGYPAEVVDLDSDLEADLGIDSIKKAQLFGELQEHFDIAQRAGNLSLDDFPTLRHVLNFLQASGPAAASVVSAAPTPVAAPAARRRCADPAVAARPRDCRHRRRQPAPADTGQLELFLVNFVVEQTGYPAEVVDLDSDLEADLGIDSIKKAQLFGELQEFFDIAAAGGQPVARRLSRHCGTCSTSSRRPVPRSRTSAASLDASHVSATVEPAPAVAAAPSPPRRPPPQPLQRVMPLHRGMPLQAMPPSAASSNRS